MKTRICYICGKEIPAEVALHCDRCGNTYCEKCAAKNRTCECAGELTYYD